MSGRPPTWDKVPATAPIPEAADLMATTRKPRRSEASRRELRRIGPLALAGLGANVINLLVTLSIARIFTTRAYGALAQLIAIYFVLNMPGSALQIGVVRRITAWQQEGHESRVPGWLARTRHRALLVLAVLVILAVSLRGTFADALSLGNPSGVTEIIVAGGLWGLLCIDRGALQAAQRYPALGRNLMVEGGLRSGLTLIAAIAGLSVGGAAAAILISVVVADIDARRSLRRAEMVGSRSSFGARAEAPIHDRRSLAKDVVVSLLSLALLAVLQSADVVLLGRARPGNAGAYAAISVSTKVLVLAALVLSSFLLPEAAAGRYAGKHALRQLGVTLSIIAVPVTILLAMAWSAPHAVLSLIFGERLTAAAPAFGILVIAMSFLATSVLAVHYLLAVGQYVVLALLTGGATLAVLLIYRAHGGFVATARADAIGQATLCAGLAVAVLYAARRAPVR